MTWSIDWTLWGLGFQVDFEWRRAKLLVGPLEVKLGYARTTWRRQSGGRR